MNVAPAALVPGEVWELIARDLTLREWAMACGACRATFEAQLTTIHIQDCSAVPPTGFAWLIRRWRRARSIYLEKLESTRLRRLTRCSGDTAPVHAQYVRFMYDFNEDGGRAMMFSTWLLAHMPELLYFSLDVNFASLTWLPPMHQLRHLELSYDAFQQRCISQLHHLSSLETLLLTEYDPTEHEEIAELDLRRLPKLQSISIGDVLCERVIVPQQCSMHLMLQGMDLSDILEYDWSGAISSLRTVYLTAHDDDPMWHLPAPLPAFLTEAWNLTWLEVRASRGAVGTAEEPVFLEGALLKLKRLTVKADNVHLRFPCGMSLEEVSIFASGVMSVSFLDLDTFVDGVRVFKFTYWGNEGQSLAALRASMITRNIPFAVIPQNGNGACLQRSPANYEFADMKSHCPCGCCFECLVKQGLVQGL